MRGPRSFEGYRFVPTVDGRHTVVFDASGGFVRLLPVFSGGSDQGEGGSGGGSGGEGGGNGGSGGDGGAGSGGSGGAGGSGGGTEGGSGGAGGSGEDDLPEAVKAELTKLRSDSEKNVAELKRARDDAAKYRTQASSRAIEQSIQTLKDAGAEEAAAALQKQLDEGGSINVDAVQQAAAKEKAEKETLASQLKTRDVRDAIRDAADEHGANFKLLYGYLTGEGTLASLDPSADDFKAKADKLVQDTIKSQPVLKKGQVPSKSGSDLNGGGTSGSEQEKDLTTAIADKLKTG